MRVWFVSIRARGRLHIEVLPDDFPGVVEEGMAAFVARVRAGLHDRFPDGGLKHVFTDRGNGFYVSCSGAMTDSLRGAQSQHDESLHVGLRVEATWLPPRGHAPCGSHGVGSPSAHKDGAEELLDRVRG